MFKILCEQYKMDAVAPEAAGAVSEPDRSVFVLQVVCVSGLPIGTPQGPQIIPIPTAVVQVAMDKAERDQLRGLLDAFDAEVVDAGEAQPEGVVARRCGRLQQHAAHTYPYTQPDDSSLLVWCDGGSVLTDAGGVSEATDELPAPTSKQEAFDDEGDRERHQAALEAGYASEADAIAEAEQFAAEAEAEAAAMDDF